MWVNYLVFGGLDYLLCGYCLPGFWLDLIGSAGWLRVAVTWAVCWDFSGCVYFWWLFYCFVDVLINYFVGLFVFVFCWFVLLTWWVVCDLFSLTFVVCCLIWFSLLLDLVFICWYISLRLVIDCFTLVLGVYLVLGLRWCLFTFIACLNVRFVWCLFCCNLFCLFNVCLYWFGCVWLRWRLLYSGGYWFEVVFFDCVLCLGWYVMLTVFMIFCFYVGFIWVIVIYLCLCLCLFDF